MIAVCAVANSYRVRIFLGWDHQQAHDAVQTQERYYETL